MNRRNRFFLILVLLMLATVPALVNVERVDAQITGTNWTGAFFNNTTLSGTPVATANFPDGLSCDWSNGVNDCRRAPTPSTPIPNVNLTNFSATFTSTQQFTQSGNYVFTIRYNDGIRVTVNNVVIVDDLTQLVDASAQPSPCTGLCKQVQVTQNLLAGPVTMRVDYVQFTDRSILQVQWGFSGGGGTGTTVPGTTPIGPTATPVPAATGMVIRVRGLAMRTGPYLGASLVNVARPERVYPILERNRDEGLFVWYKIAAGDSQGWVSGRYFEVTGNIEAIPFTNSIFDQIDDAPDIGVVGVTRAIMNMRRRPSERVQIIDKIPWGAEVPVIGRTIQAFDEFWLQVRYNGKVGWIYAPYVGLRGVVDAVPVR
jgi:uncharacterized protein YraI